MIYLLRARATSTQLGEMLEELTDYVKLAVDVEHEIMEAAASYMLIARLFC
jgi:hypothetical protein